MGGQRGCNNERLGSTNISQVLSYLDWFNENLPKMHIDLINKLYTLHPLFMFTLREPFTPKVITPPKPWRYYFAISWEGCFLRPGYCTQVMSSLASSHSANARELSRWRWTLSDKVSKPNTNHWLLSAK